MQTISGFSKLSKEEKLNWLNSHFLPHSIEAANTFRSFWHDNQALQAVIDGFSENTISNFVIPFGIAPNFIINGKTYAVPMAIEESSVVAAASSAAKFWMTKGGFHAEVIGTQKIGQVHFTWSGGSDRLQRLFPDISKALLNDVQALTSNMQKRGGGILGIELLDFTAQEPDYYQLKVAFETCDSMGANFINSILEAFGVRLKSFLLVETDEEPEIIMAILSNYTPECLVRAWVECPVAIFGGHKGISGEVLAEKFSKAIRIATIDPYRATTHNKGIFNGIDAVALATANDFRAIEACGHAYAARDGQYRSLSRCTISNGIFRFELEIPLALGTVGGLTNLHPLAQLSLEMLGNPSAKELMKIIAVTGLAQNFAAVRSLVTSGIQQGHMKMHLGNILNHFAASESEASAIKSHFDNKTISFNAVNEYLLSLRTKS